MVEDVNISELMERIIAQYDALLTKREGIRQEQAKQAKQLDELNQKINGLRIRSGPNCCRLRMSVPAQPRPNGWNENGISSSITT